jgi:hypothetical protein
MRHSAALIPFTTFRTDPDGNEFRAARWADQVGSGNEVAEAGGREGV